MNIKKKKENDRTYFRTKFETYSDDESERKRKQDFAKEEEERLREKEETKIHQWDA